jgi:predicted Ser/Thr protein kinase
MRSPARGTVIQDSRPRQEEKLKLMEWLEDTVAIKNKREIVREVAKAFEDNIILVTERKKPLGVFIKFNEENKEKLPPEVRFFLSAVLNAAGCKLLKQATNS